MMKSKRFNAIVNITTAGALIFVVLVVLHDVIHWKWFISLPKKFKS
jgi:hypothetical protein